MTTPPTPAGWYPDPDGSGGQRYWDGSVWTEHRSPATPEPAEPAEPLSDDRRNLAIKFGVACAVLLAVLVAVVIYGVFINKNDTIQISSSPGSTSKSAAPTTSSSSAATTGESPSAPSGSNAQASDGGLTFAITQVETSPTVKYQDAPVEKTAQGEFLIVHMTVLNSGSAQGTFLAMLQKLKAGGTAYSIDDEATAYLNGTSASLNPGSSADLAIAFDVPKGTTPDSLEVHGEPMSTGVDVPLS